MEVAVAQPRGVDLQEHFSGVGGWGLDLDELRLAVPALEADCAHDYLSKIILGNASSRQ
jgi:hypothetical protein